MDLSFPLERECPLLLAAVQVVLLGAGGESLVEDVRGDLDDHCLFADLTAGIPEKLPGFDIGHLDTVVLQNIPCRHIDFTGFIIAEELELNPVLTLVRRVDRSSCCHYVSSLERLSNVHE